MTYRPHFVGEDYYRYKLFCNELALKLLEFGIHYNNNNKEDWNAPTTALHFAKLANDIAIDETLRERCKKNVEIFENNVHITQTEKAIEVIDEKIKKIDGIRVTFSEIETTLKSITAYLDVVRDHAGKDSAIYLNESSRVVNIFLNRVIDICNYSKSFFTDSGAAPILKQLQKMDMTSETKNRLNRNSEIISRNMMAAIKQGDFGDLSCKDSKTNPQANNNSKQCGNKSKHKYSAKENKVRIIHKIITTVISAIMIAFTHWCIINGTPEQWFILICNIIISIHILFLLVMWLLELQRDPRDSDINWFYNMYEKIADIANEIESAGVRGGKTYSWPLAIPFHLLALLFMLIGLIVKGLTKIAVLIK